MWGGMGHDVGQGNVVWDGMGEEWGVSGREVTMAMGAFSESPVASICWQWLMYLSFVSHRRVKRSASKSLWHISVPGSADYAKR